MNSIHILSAQPWVERLGSTLLHFLWQGILIAALYAGTRKWIARSSAPNVHYMLACAALALMAAAPVVLEPAAPAGARARRGILSQTAFRRRFARGAAWARIVSNRRF